tara:strand:+ start:120 stop:470 length:351 start_codon:yes stop_codon:yes gene_type:complete
MKLPINKIISLDKDVLKVSIDIQKKLYKNQETIWIKTEDVLDMIKSDYNVIGIVSECKGVCNGTKKKGFSTSGTWLFKIKKTRKPAQKTQKKTPSIKSRMSNIAKKVKESKQDDFE